MAYGYVTKCKTAFDCRIVLCIYIPYFDQTSTLRVDSVIRTKTRSCECITSGCDTAIVAIHEQGDPPGSVLSFPHSGTSVSRDVQHFENPGTVSRPHYSAALRTSITDFSKLLPIALNQQHRDRIVPMSSTSSSGFWVAVQHAAVEGCEEHMLCGWGEREEHPHRM
jgi:hypothetical protein